LFIYIYIYMYMYIYMYIYIYATGASEVFWRVVLWLFFFFFTLLWCDFFVVEGAAKISWRVVAVGAEECALSWSVACCSSGVCLWMSLRFMLHIWISPLHLWMSHTTHICGWHSDHIIYYITYMHAIYYIIHICIPYTI